MKKNFLLLLLMTLLPLAGWAQHLASTEDTYSGTSKALPTVFYDAGETQVIPVGTGSGTYLTVGSNTRFRVSQWTYSGASVTNYKDAGTYTATVQRQTRSGSYSPWGSWGTYETLTFTVEKADVTVTLYQVVREWKNPWANPELATLESTAYVVTGADATWDKIVGSMSWNQIQPVTDVNSYKYTMDAGVHKNYVIHVDAGAADLKVEKNTTGDWTTVATAGDDLTYNGEEQSLEPKVAPVFWDSDDNIAGTIEYSLDGANWSEEYPKGKDADTYTVQYRGVGDINHTDAKSIKTYTVKINKYTLVEGTDFTAPEAVIGTEYDEAAHEIATAGAFTGKFAAELATAGAKFQYNGADDLPEETNVGTYSFDWDIDLGTSTNFTYTTGATTVAGATIVETDIVAADVTAPVGATGLKYILDTDQELIATGAVVATDNYTHAAKGTPMYSVDGGAYTDDLTKIVGEHVKANDAKYVVSWYVKGDANHNDYGSETTPAGTVEVAIAPVQFVLAADAEPATGLVYSAAAQKLVAKSVTGGAGNMPQGSTSWKLNGADVTGTYEDIKGTNAGTYTISYTVVPKDAKYENDYLPYNYEFTAYIDQYTLYIGAKTLTGTVEQFVDLETMTPKFKMSDFLKDGAFIGGESDTEKEAILNQLIAPVETPAQIIAASKAGSATVVTLKTVTVDPDVTPMNYKVDDATLLSDNASLNITAIEAAIQADPVAATLTYNGDDQELVGTAAVGYKANGGAGTVAIGKVVYSLEEAGTYTDDLTKIVGKDADTYTVYYKVELSDEATSLDRFYKYDAAVKSINVTIDQKELDIAMFEFDPASQKAVYNGQNQLPVITTVAGEPITDADWYFEFEDGAGNPIANPNEGVKDVDVYTITFKAEADGNYKEAATPTTATWEITAKELADEMFILSENVTYNGEAQKPTITTKEGEPIVNADYTIEVKDSEGNLADIDNLVAADTYTFNFIAAAGGNYQGSASQDWTIAQKALDIAMFTLSSYEETYDGTNLMPTFEFADGDPSALVAADFTVATTNSKPEAVTEMVNADTYTFTFKAAADGNYTGEVSADFVINQDEAEFVLAKAENLTYNGANQALVTEASTDAVDGVTEYQVVQGEKVLVDWTEDFAAVVAKNAGEYTVKTKFTASEINYSNPEVEKDVTVTIDKAVIGYMLGGMTKVWDGEPITEEANGEQLEKVFTLYAGGDGGKLFDGDQYDVPFTLSLPEDYRDADSYSFTQAKVEFKEGYPVNYKINFAGTGNVVIEKADIAAEDFTAPAAVAEDLTYNGEEQDLVVAGEVTAKTDAEYPNTELAGKPFGTIMYATAEDGEYSETAPKGKDADDYEVWYYVKGDKNHNDTDPVKIEKSIAPKAIEFTLAFEDAEIPFDGKDKMPADLVAYDGEKALVEGTDYELTINDEAVTEETKLINADTYVFAYTGKGNYEGSDAEATITITKVELTEAMIEEFVAEKPYTGNDQIFDLALEADGITAADYTVAKSAEEFINAGEYTFTFTAAADGNFTGEVEATFTIKPLEVIAEAAAATKVYDGEEGFGELPVMTYSGVLPGDEVEFDASAAFTIKESSANVGTYTFTVDPEAIVADPANYTVSAANGNTFEITAAPLMVSWNDEADPFSKVYGADDPELTATAANLDIAGAIDGEEEAIIAQTVITRAEGEAVGKYAVTLAADEDADPSVFANYAVEFNGYAEAFEITQAKVKVSIAALDKTYDGKAATIEVKAEDLVVTGLQNGDKKEDIFTTLPTATVGSGEEVNAGTYQVTLEGGEAADYEFEFIPATFTVKPAKVTATLTAQKVQQGKTLNEDAFTAEGIAEGDEDLFYVDAPGLVDMDGIVTGAAGVYAEGLTLAADESVADNYTIEATPAELEIIAADAIVLADNADFKTEAKNGVDVTFADRSINAGTWNVLALPFEATVKQISDAFGYAAVDILNEDGNTPGEVHFKVISSGTIPAYTPFIIKTTEDAGLAKDNFNQVVFHNVNIEACDGTNNSVEDAAKNKFWGTFQAVTTFHGAQYWYMSKGVWKDASKYTASKPVSLKAFRAYVEFKDVPAEGARIFVEEPDGTITAINGLEFNKAMDAEGWFTVNGMKLDEAPAQKGTYIKDGKKVIVK